MPDEPETPPRGVTRPAPACDRCGEPTRFEDGRQIHDVWAERFVCPACGAETYRSYGRGSV